MADGLPGDAVFDATPRCRLLWVACLAGHEMLIAFRTDASAATGSGHLMRCLALAESLRDRGAEIVFICRHIQPDLADRIENTRYRLFRLARAAQPVDTDRPTRYAGWLGTNWKADAEETRELLTKTGYSPDWLVVDHYALDARWERTVRPGVEHLLAIDDLGDREHDCDLLLDQNLHAVPHARYEGKVAPACRLLLGPRYALMRREFAVARQALARGPVGTGRVLVFMGGVDAGNMTRTVIQGALALRRPDLFLEVVIAAPNPNAVSIESEFGGLPNVAIHVAVQDMAQRLARADIAIGAGGGAMLERACLSLPSLTIAIAENQEPGARSLGLWGATLYLGRAADVDSTIISHALAVMLHSETLRLSMAERAAAVVDGKGAERVARCMLGSTLRLRMANAGDCESIFNWRNDLRTRRFSGDGRAIERSAHERWFAALLASPARRMLIAEDAGAPVGVLRYDINHEQAEVSIYLVPGNHGRGLGEAILVAGEQWLSRACPDVRELGAVVLRENLASLGVFAAAGFEEHSAFLRKRVSANV